MLQQSLSQLESFIVKDLHYQAIRFLLKTICAQERPLNIVKHRKHI